MVKSFYVNFENKTKVETVRPSADLKNVSKDAKGNLVLEINIPEDNLETDIKVIVAKNQVGENTSSDEESCSNSSVNSKKEENFKEKKDTLKIQKVKKGKIDVSSKKSKTNEDSEEDLSPLDEFRNQLSKFAKTRSEISNSSDKYWKKDGADSKSKIQCLQCDRQISRKRGLDHSISHLKDYYPFFCFICDRKTVKFKSWALVVAHFKRHHGSFYENYKNNCEKCGKETFIKNHSCAPPHMPINKKKKPESPAKVLKKRGRGRPCKKPSENYRPETPTLNIAVNIDKEKNVNFQYNLHEDSGKKPKSKYQNPIPSVADDLNDAIREADLKEISDSSSEFSLSCVM